MNFGLKLAKKNRGKSADFPGIRNLASRVANALKIKNQIVLFSGQGFVVFKGIQDEAEQNRRTIFRI